MSGYLVPAMAVLAILLGLFKRVDVYAAFADGAGKGLPVLLKILPNLAAMLISIRLLREGGVLDLIASLLQPLFTGAGLDSRLLPLILMRPFSGSASMALMKEIFTQCGPDSTAGLTASILMGSSETIFYEVALYFGSVGIRKTRFAVPLALCASALSGFSSLILGRLLSGGG